MKQSEKAEEVVRYLGALPDGTHVIEHPDGHLERQRSKTDWARVDALTDEEIDKAIADDPDWAELKDIDWSEAVVLFRRRRGRFRSVSTKTCSTSSSARAPATSGA